jgi:CRP/FNR family transcriptional regulator, cyclic AMP receptor protein
MGMRSTPEDSPVKIHTLAYGLGYHSVGRICRPGFDLCQWYCEKLASDSTQFMPGVTMTPTQIQELLTENALFSGLEHEHLKFLSTHAAENSFPQDQVFARQGEHADYFLLLLEGELVVEVPAITGPRLEVTRLGQGQVFGWSWLIDPYKWHFNARAAKPIRAIQFDGQAILAHCDEDPAFGYALFRRFSMLMGQRLEVAQRQMMDQWSPPGFA